MTEVILHPLVLLSVADHYNRVAKDARDKRVVGVLLGSKSGNTIDACNSYAVPFEEDVHNPKVWFLDHNFLDSMFWMFKKVNSKESIVGFYSSGPKIKENDIEICELMKQVGCSIDPIFVIVDIRPDIVGIPTTAYSSVEELTGEGKELRRVFKNITCRIEAEEAEQVGVEHLLRDINDTSTSQLTAQIKLKLHGLTGLRDRLADMASYLDKVASGQLPPNQQILANMQNMFNLLPNLNVDELVHAMLVHSNDTYLALYVATLVRSVISLHDLLLNKFKYRGVEEFLETGVLPASVIQAAAASAAASGVTTTANGSATKPEEKPK